MTTTSIKNRDREAAILSAVTMAFVYSSHLTGKARIGDLSGEDAHRLLKEAQDAEVRLFG